MSQNNHPYVNQLPGLNDLKKNYDNRWFEPIRSEILKIASERLETQSSNGMDPYLFVWVNIEDVQASNLVKQNYQLHCFIKNNWSEIVQPIQDDLKVEGSWTCVVDEKNIGFGIPLK